MDSNLLLEKHRFLMIAKSALGIEAFLAPIMTLFYLDYVGISFSEYALFQTLLFILAGILELPTGVISDTFGRKQCLVVAELIYLTAMLLLVLIPSKTTVWICAVLYPLGATLGSGNLRGIVYELFKQHDREGEFHSISSRASGMQLLCGAIASLGGGYLAAIYLPLPMIIDCVLLAISILLTVTILNDDKKNGLFKNLPHTGFKRSTKIFFDGINYLRESPSLLVLIVISASFFAIVRGVFLLYQPLLMQSGFNIQSLGIIFALFGAISGLGAFLSRRVLKKIGSEKRYILFIIGLAIASTILIYGNDISEFIVLGAILCHQGIRGLYPPFFSFTISKGISQGHSSRTTLYSVANVVNAIFCGVAILYLGCVARNGNYSYGFIWATLVLTGVSVCGFLIMLYLDRKTEAKRVVQEQEYVASRS